MRLFIFLFAIASLLCFTACQNSNANAESNEIYNANNEIPSLLDRPEKIQNGKEWEKVQNIYGGARQELLKTPADSESYLKLAEVFINEARITGEHGHYYPAALKVLDNALAIEKERSDKRFRALTMKAAVQLSQHEFPEALETGKEAITINAYNAQIYGVLTDAFVELGNYEAAVAMADKMISIRPDLRSYSRISYLREIHGDVVGAKEAMAMAVSAGYPGYEQTSWARLTLGELHETYGDLEKAAYEYQMALAERENYPFAIAALASIEAKKGNTEKAEELLKQAADIIPEVGFYISLAGLYQSTDREVAAQEMMPEIMEMLEDDVKHGHNMNMEFAHVHLDLTKDYDKALEYLLVEYELRPENIDVNKSLAIAYVAKGNYDQAATHVEKASITNSQAPELLCVRGLIALHKGQKINGLKDLEMSWKSDPYQSHVLAEKARQYKS